MRAALVLLGLVALLVLLVFLLSQPPIEVLQNTTMGMRAGPEDTGPQGSSLVYYLLGEEGYNVTVSPSPGRVTVLLGAVDERAVASLVLPGAARAAGEHGSAVVLVSTNRPATLLRGATSVLESMGWTPGAGTTTLASSLSDLILKRPMIAVGPSGTFWPVKSVYTSPVFTRNSTSPAGAGSVLVLSYLPESPDRVAALMVTFTRGDSRLYLVLFSDPESMTNMVVYPLLQRGINPGPYLRDLLSALGAGPGTTIYVPPEAFKTYGGGASNPAPLRIETRSAVASMLSWISRRAWALVDSLSRSPLSMIALGVLALLAGYLLARGVAGSPLAGPALGPVRPLEPVRSLGLSREFELASSVGGRLEKLSKPQAKRVIAALYELADSALRRLYGVGLEEAAEKGLLAPREGQPLTGDPRLDKVLERLLIVYKRKVLARKLLPIVNIRREAARLYRELLPFLEKARIKLEGERGVEYTGI